MAPTPSPLNGIRFRMGGPPGEHPGCWRMLKQVIYNLLSNALKFTPQGGEIRLRALAADDCSLSLGGKEDQGFEGVKSALIGKGSAQHPFVLISVKDTGIGIKAEDLERIFIPFEQADNAAARHYSGAGLGLSLARKFVELHEGKIWAESEGPGKGSDFKFCIPVRSPKK